MCTRVFYSASFSFASSAMLFQIISIDKRKQNDAENCTKWKEKKTKKTKIEDVVAKLTCLLNKVIWANYFNTNPNKMKKKTTNASYTSFSRGWVVTLNCIMEAMRGEKKIILIRVCNLCVVNLQAFVEFDECVISRFLCVFSVLSCCRWTFHSICVNFI